MGKHKPLNKENPRWLQTACPAHLGWSELTANPADFCRSTGFNRDYLLHPPLRQMQHVLFVQSAHVESLEEVASPMLRASPEDTPPGHIQVLRGVMAAEFFDTAEGHEDLVHGGAMLTVIDTVMGQMCMVLHQDIVLTLTIHAKYLRPVFRPSPENISSDMPNRVYRVDLFVGPTEKPRFYRCHAFLRDPDFSETSVSLAEFTALFYGVPSESTQRIPQLLLADIKHDPYPQCASYQMGMKIPFPITGWLEEMKASSDFIRYTDIIFSQYQESLKARKNGGRDFLYSAPKILFEYFYKPSNNTLYCPFHFLPTSEGPPGCVHGGAIFTSFDDAFTTYINIAFSEEVKNTNVLTASLEVRYLKMTPLCITSLIEVVLVKKERNKVFLSASFSNPATGTVHSTATALFVIKERKPAANL